MGCSGSTSSTSKAALSAIRRAPQLGQKPRRLQLKATRCSAWQDTGLRQKVASAQAEHHLVADVAWAVIQYWQTTGDESFIAHEGMALLLETAKFWISRAVRVNDRL